MEVRLIGTQCLVSYVAGIWLRSKWAAGRARLRPILVDRGANSKAARPEPRAAIFHASILSSVICYLSCASRLTSVAWGKELFKPGSSRIICPRDGNASDTIL